MFLVWRLFKCTKTLVHENGKLQTERFYCVHEGFAEFIDAGCGVGHCCTKLVQFKRWREQTPAPDSRVPCGSGKRGPRRTQACTNIICLKYCRQHHKIKSKSTAMCASNEPLLVLISPLFYNPIFTPADNRQYLPHNNFTIKFVNLNKS